MRWFRFYSEVVQDGKVQRLSAPMFRWWVNLLCIANDGKPRGRLPELRDVAYALHLKEARAGLLLTEFTRLGLLDEIDGRLVPHNWDERQPAWDDAALRQKRHRERGESVTQGRDIDVTSDVLEENRREENRTEKNRKDAEVDNIFRLYEQTIGPFDPHMATKLKEAEKEYAQECIRHSFQEASENNARSWRYIETILKAHKANGCYTAKRVESDTTDWEERYQRGKARA